MQTSSRFASELHPLPHLAETLRCRRGNLAQQIDFPVVLWSGRSSARNFPANVYPYRANSHFLYFAGLPLYNAAIHLEAGRLALFMDDPTPAHILWHGDTPRRDQIAQAIGADAAYPLSQLEAHLADAATVPVQDAATRLDQSQYLSTQAQALAKAIVNLRLIHDEGAIAEMRKAARVTVAAHRAGMAATRRAQTEAQIRAAMEQVIMANQMTCAYSSIVTVHGEVLHSDRYSNAIQPHDLLLADVGAEAESGWASDVTRTWPVSGKFSPTQRDIYSLVLSAHDRCIAAACPGVEYQDLHLLAADIMAAGLVDLGILKGNSEDLVAQDAHALFFPHGIGHLLGLDVHDMEDLGDLAGYAEGRTRSDRFGLGYLRLNRPLQLGMAVTIEPGFYQVPALLNDPERREKYRQVVDWDRLAQFSDVRGIRIEDDLLITETGNEILTAALPTQMQAIEQWVS
ncbi:MAG: aminopeptidase P family protein [Drouetiella hepatica Uher 2000/2452]|jgi:Xaa-Pro aminopeptidase/Xaa-Pro dipeptidase|uniref:Xaa-Pro aminopeptidase n=1 Tax=Drouetiella hepatica Uher 2000/2452 TaxID=904376 RepID=A0A951QFK3_9CYAN|nr:aminopeptidase P family protein [Drouetiella hepatica Uher 2000/2452]